MSERSHRLSGHVRRHGIAYVALAGVLALSPVPSMAAELVTTADIANGAVTTPKLAADSVVGGKIANETVAGTDIKNGTIGNADLAEAAKGAKVIRYDLGSFDFSTGETLVVDLPGTWNAATMAASSWSAAMTFQGLTYVVPGHGHFADTDYSLLLSFGSVGITPLTGPGEEYDAIYIYRTVVTSTQDAPQP